MCLAVSTMIDRDIGQEDYEGNDYGEDCEQDEIVYRPQNDKKENGSIT